MPEPTRDQRLDGAIPGAIYALGLALELLRECIPYLPEASGIREEITEELPDLATWLAGLKEAYEA